MRKRLLSVIVTLLCVMACVFALAACDGNPGNNEGGNGDAQTVAVESVTLDKTELTLEIGGEETLAATVSPDNATNKTVAWSSDNTAVATVADGKVTAVAAGTATITATADGKSATCSVTVNAPAPTTEVTAEEWAKIMERIDNFTFTNTVGEHSMTAKIDGAARSQSQGGLEQIFVKEENEYFSYDNFGGSWKKSSITEGAYNDSNATAQLVTYFRDDYASFTYADGKYTAASVDKTATMNGVLHNVEITFENGALVGIKFSVIYGESTFICEVNDVGTTVVTLPTEYTDETASSQNSIAGKTFVFKDVTCQSEGADASLLEMMKEANSGATVAFGTDGTIIYTTPVQSCVQWLTYEQNGTTITAELERMEIGGDDMPFGEQEPVQFTFENGELVQEVTIQNVVYTVIYELQPEE